MFVNNFFTYLTCAYLKKQTHSNVKSSTHYFHVKTKILSDFQICISLTLSNIISPTQITITPSDLSNIISPTQITITPSDLNNIILPTEITVTTKFSILYK